MLRQSIVFVALVVLVLSATGSSFYNQNALDVTGTWELTVDADGQEVNVTLKLDQTEKAFTGTVSTPFGDGTVTNGKVTDDTISATLDVEIQGQPMSLTLNGKVVENDITGSITGDAIPEATFTGKKSVS
jgi:hypothetical protein